MCESRVLETKFISIIIFKNYFFVQDIFMEKCRV
jgi:hypothetical protein